MTVLRWIGAIAVLAGVLLTAQWLSSGTPSVGPLKPYVWQAPTGLPASPPVPQPRGTQVLDPCPGGYTLWNSCYGGRKDR